MRNTLLKLILLLNILNAKSDKLEDLFSNCRISDANDFDECLKFTLNHLNPLFKHGLPEYNVAPFDPHKQSFVEQRRGDRNGLAGYRLLLTGVSEYGWTKSLITKLRYGNPK